VQFLVIWSVYLNFLEKSLLYLLFHELGTDSDLDRPNPDWHALDADPDPEPAKCCGSDPIRILSHNTVANTAKLLICLFVLPATASPILAGSTGERGMKPIPRKK
jgi:hypothetical protein